MLTALEDGSAAERQEDQRYGTWIQRLDLGPFPRQLWELTVQSHLPSGRSDNQGRDLHPVDRNARRTVHKDGRSE